MTGNERISQYQGVPAAADLDLIVALQGESLPVSWAPSSNTDPDVCIARTLPTKPSPNLVYFKMIIT